MIHIAMRLMEALFFAGCMVFLSYQQVILAHTATPVFFHLF